jgi:uncharacterized protein
MEQIERWQEWTDRWQPAFLEAATQAMAGADPGHDLQHVRRVLTNATHVGRIEGALPEVVLPAAWLHDCVTIPKNSPDRSRASCRSAVRAREILEQMGYPVRWQDRIAHAIVAHSFSANVPCQSLEAQVVQDADRLEALGALGIARCLMTGGAMHQRLYEPDEPFPDERPPKDDQQSIDHFFAKLLRLPETMQTFTGRGLARQRTGIMVQFLDALRDELGVDRERLQAALARHAGEREHLPVRSPRWDASWNSDGRT